MMSNRLLIASCVLSMAASAALATPQSPGMAVVRDADTGELRAATGAEIRALQGPQSKTATPVETPQAVTRPDGTRSARLGERGMVYSTVTRAPDGSMTQRCIEGESAAVHAAHSQAKAPQHKEPAHDR